MHVGDTAQQLLEDVLASVLGQPLVRHFLYVMVDTHSLTKLHDEVDMGALVYDLVQFHNAGVPEIGKRIDLPVDCLLGLPILQVLLIVGFDRNNVFCLFMSRTAHDGKSALAHLQINLKFV